jgi:hypothetical protein
MVSSRALRAWVASNSTATPTSEIVGFDFFLKYWEHHYHSFTKTCRFRAHALKVRGSSCINKNQRGLVLFSYGFQVATRVLGLNRNNLSIFDRVRAKLCGIYVVTYFFYQMSPTGKIIHHLFSLVIS